MSELKNKTVKGVLWSAIERFSVQGIQFIVMLVMARLLTPSDYGMMGLAVIFIAVSNTLVDSGFSQALIRKQNRTELDKSTVFYFNIIVSLLLYILCYIGAPYVADFYKLPDLTDIIRVISLSVIINSFAVVQRAQFLINVDFKSQAKCSLIAAIISGCVGIFMAYNGYGVWSLVVQQLVSGLINTCALWIISNWRPTYGYSWKSFNDLFSFGSKMMASGLLDTAYREIYPIIVGKLFSPDNLGHYTRAKHFAEFPSSNLTAIMQRVTYPVLCEIQNEDERLREVYRKFLKMSTYIIFPLMMGLSALAHPFIRIAIGVQWDFCAEILQVICFAMMWYPVHAINLNLLQVKGRSDLFLKLEIIKKILNLTVIITTAPFGLMMMCYGQIFNSIIALMINTYYTGKLINLGFVNQMKDLLPTIMLGGVMYICVYCCTFVISNIYLQVVGGTIIGIMIYLTGSKILKFTELQDIKSLIRRKI